MMWRVGRGSGRAKGSHLAPNELRERRKGSDREVDRQERDCLILLHGATILGLRTNCLQQNKPDRAEWIEGRGGQRGAPLRHVSS
jgi:hypothetical protein